MQHPSSYMYLKSLCTSMHIHTCTYVRTCSRLANSHCMRSPTMCLWIIYMYMYTRSYTLVAATTHEGWPSTYTPLPAWSSVLEIHTFQLTSSPLPSSRLLQVLSELCSPGSFQSCGRPALLPTALVSPYRPSGRKKREHHVQCASLSTYKC